MIDTTRKLPEEELKALAQLIRVGLPYTHKHAFDAENGPRALQQMLDDAFTKLRRLACSSPNCAQIEAPRSS